jgi:hypothetical protein
MSTGFCQTFAPWDSQATRIHGTLNPFKIINSFEDDSKNICSQKKLLLRRGIQIEKALFNICCFSTRGADCFSTQGADSYDTSS